MNISLIALQAHHASAMVRWLSQPNVRENLGLRRTITHESTTAWIQEGASDSSIAAFAIYGGEEHVGNVTLDRIDSHSASARFSIYIGPEYQGKGYATQATQLVLQKAFGEFGLNKVWLIVHVRNTAGIRAYVAAGFEVEGVLREEFLLAGERINALYMGLLRKDLPSGSGGE